MSRVGAESAKVGGVASPGGGEAALRRRFVWTAVGISVVHLALQTRPPIDHAEFTVFAQVACALLVLALMPALQRNGRGSGLRWLPVLLVATLAVRAPLLLHPPGFSDDVHRYLWEGRVLAAGFDPWDHAPVDPLLSSLAGDAPEWRSVGHRDLPAIYPPGAVGAFAIHHSLGGGGFSFRLVLLAAELINVLLLARLLVRRGRSPAWAALYGLHPLASWEGVGQGHYEPLAFVPMLLALDGAERGLGARASALAGLAALFKYVGVLPWWFHTRERVLRRSGQGAHSDGAGSPEPNACRPGLRERVARWLGPILPAAIVVTVPYAVLSADGQPPFGSSAVYAEHWTHNASIAAALVALLGSEGRTVAGFAMVVWGLFQLWFGGRREDPARTMLVTMAGWLLLSPVVHPWYGLWALIWLPLAPNAPLGLWLSLLPLAALVHTSGGRFDRWEPPLWVPWIEYGLPALAFILIPRVRWGRNSPHPEDPAPAGAA